MPFNFYYSVLNKLRLQKTGCDVVFQIGDHEFSAHRKVMMDRMEYFQVFLAEDTVENEKFPVVLNPEIIELTYFSAFLDYVYTSKIDFTNENIRAIYKTAEYFRFDELIDKIFEHMKNNMKGENVSYFRTIAKVSGLESLGNVFPKITSQQVFRQGIVNELSRDEIIPVLSFKHLKIFLEKLEEDDRSEKMFHYSFDWVFADEVNRSGMLLELLKNIPLESLSFDFLKAASHYELIRKDNECLKLLFDAFITASKSDVRKERRQRIDNLYAKYILYAIGGTDGGPLSSVSLYNSATREWTATTPMPSERTHFGCAVIGHRIYVCGGHDGKREMNDLTVFDTYTRTWTQLTPMKHARELCAAAALNGQIYVAGGLKNNNVLAVVERYNVQSQQWKDVAPMTTKRGGLELVALDGFLYAIGGHDDINALNSVERYDPQTDQWTRMNNTNYKYNTFGSAVLNNKIYIAKKEKCEVYSPADDKWTEMPAPSECDDGRRLAVYDEKLYVIGGLVGELKYWKGIKSVEVYDFEARVWLTEPDMNVARCFHSVAVVKRTFFVPIKIVFEANESLNKLRLQNTGCDVILEIGGHEFPAHQKVLIARLEYFRKILTVHTEKENESVISLDSKIINPTFFGEILHYIYTSKITFTNENIRPIYRAAEYFQFHELIYELKEHMEFTVNMNNIDSYQTLSIELGQESMLGVFAQYIIQQIFSHINKCSREKLTLTLSKKPLGELLQKLNEDGSLEDMFHYTVDWIVHDEVNRFEMLLVMLKNIPLKKLSSNFLIEVVAQNDLVRNNTECLNLVLNTIITFRTSHNESSENTLYAIGGMDGDRLSSVSQYNSTTREWTATTPMPGKRSHFGCAVIDHKIYVCGGYDGDQSMNELTVFDTLTRTWTQLTPMKHARQNFGAAALNGQIYIAGGWNGTEVLAVVERYNVQSDRWEDATPMTAKRSGLELVVLNGFLYAIGGYDGSDGLKIVERYDPLTDQWTRMNNTNNKYNAFGSAVLNDNIYIADGYTFEVYHTAFKRWIEMPAPSKCYYGRRLAVFNGKLYEIGGEAEEEGWKGSKTVEVYDFETRAWTSEPDMDVARCLHVELNGFLYAIGGHIGDAPNSVERYDPQTDQWLAMASMNSRYNSFGSAVLNGYIYVLGRNKCEVYYPADDRWIEMPAPRECQYGVRLAAYDGKLYAIGGRVGELKDWKGSKAVEVFDLQAQVWRPVPDMDAARCFHGLAVVTR